MATILIGENVPDLAELIRLVLGRAGHETHSSRDGEDVLAKARETHPDLLVMNPALPGLDGLDVCRRLRGESGTRELPILLLSARQFPADMQAAYAAGADAYLGKPFSAEALTAAANGLLERTAVSGTWPA